MSKDCIRNGDVRDVSDKKNNKMLLLNHIYLCIHENDILLFFSDFNNTLYDVKSAVKESSETRNSNFNFQVY